jgi:hypothetical protein
MFIFFLVASIAELFTFILNFYFKTVQINLIGAEVTDVVIGVAAAATVAAALRKLSLFTLHFPWSKVLLLLLLPMLQKLMKQLLLLILLLYLMLL